VPHASFAVDFGLDIDRALQLITVTVTGVLSPEDVGWIAEEVRAAILSLGPDAGRHRTLYDLRGVLVLPQETTDLALRSLRGGTPDIWARRRAFVATTMLTKRQARRMAEARPGSSVFDDIGAARAWLLEE